MAEISSPIEHRHYSRLIGPVARESTYHWRAVLVFSAILFLGSLLASADPLFTAYLGPATILFFTMLGSLTLLISLMTKSFRKALVVAYSSVALLPVTLLLAYVIPHAPTGIEGLFATIALSTAIGVNFTLVKKYFDERRKPATVMTAIFETFSKLSRATAGVYILETLTFLGVAAFAYELTGALGLFVAFANVLSILATVTILPAAIMSYEHAMAARMLSEHEEKVLGYARSYGTNRKHSGIIAGWVGMAVADVEKAVERLVAKGYLGSSFFAVDDPFVWFLLVGTYFLGAIFSRNGLPSVASVWYDLGIAFLITVSICLFAPQNLPGVPKSIRRFLGILLAIATVIVAFRTSSVLAEIALALLVLGTLSVFFGSAGLAIVGNAAVAVYFALTFLLGWMQFDYVETTPKLWAVGIGAIIFLAQMLIEEEAYVPIKR